MAFTDSDREAVLEALAIEQRLKHEGKPYSEAVIMACEICLRVNARKPSAEPPHYTMPQPAEPEPAQRAKYWWQDKD